MPKLTMISVHNWKPTTTRQEVLDPGTRGLYFIVQPSGVKSWALRYRRKSDGAAVKHTIGSYPAIDLKAARAAAMELWPQIERGADPHGDKIVARHAVAADNSFEAVARRYIETHQFRHHRSWEWTAHLLGLAIDGPAKDVKTCPPLAVIKDGAKDRQGRRRISLVDRWGSRRIADITRADIGDVLDRIAGNTPVMANRMHAVLSALFNWAIKKDLALTNPLANLDRAGGKEQSRDRVLSDAELAKVWHAAGELGHPWAGVVRLLILTGQRKGEIAHLHWSEIDLDERMIHFPKERTKNAQPHDVPLSALALATIAGIRRLPDADLVFTIKRRPISGFSRMKERLDAASGVPDFTLHDLRRTCASGLQRLGVRLEVTEAVLNHKSGSTAGIVGVYQRHDYADEKRAALERWADHVDAIVSGEKKGKVVTLRGR